MFSVLKLQKCQLSKDNSLDGIIDDVKNNQFLGELSHDEGDKIPFVIRTGPMSKPDPGIMKRYEAVEINGAGVAFVMIWIQERLVAWGTLFAQEGPNLPRRLNIPRGLGNGYGIDVYIAMQGRLTGLEVLFDVLGGEEA